MVSFVKRRLTPCEAKSINFERLGIEDSRQPPEAWEWAVDEKNDLYFTQLISSSGAYGEQREGRYFYLLIVEQEPVVTVLTGKTIKRIFCSLEEAQFLDFGALRKHPIKQLVKMVNAAAIILCHDKKPFSFRINEPICRFPLSSFSGFEMPRAY